MNKVKVSAVSYLNTKPFIYGIQQSGFEKKIHLSLDMPSLCADKLISRRVDVGLIPAAIIPRIDSSQIISDYCIGASGKVRTVVLASEVPLEQVQSVVLDYQSRTSVLLCQVLANFFWRITPQWIQGTAGYETQSIHGNTAGVIIGDRVFELEKRFPYIYDLSEEWTNYTGRDFVFACWTANKSLPSEFCREFNEALELGVSNIEKVIKAQNGQAARYDLEQYFRDNISFTMNESKQKGLELFWKYAKKLDF